MVVTEHLARGGTDCHQLKVIATVHLERAQMSLDEQTAPEALLAQHASTLRTLGLLLETSHDTHVAKQMAVLALSRMSEELQTDATLELASEFRIEDAVLGW